MKIGVVGLWHLGCVISASWSWLKHDVIGFDYDNNIVDNLVNFGEPPIYEPKLKNKINLSLIDETLKFTKNISDLSDRDIIFLSYDTPVNNHDESNTYILYKSIENLSKILKNDTIVIISSQSPIGTCSDLRNILKKYNNKLELAYSPENLRLGDALNCYLNPNRIVLGTKTDETEKRCSTLFKEITLDKNILKMSLESAEMVKHGINSFLATSIVFADHLSNLCHTSGADIEDVVKGIKSDERIGQKSYLSPGIGFSGGTLGRDLKVLSKLNNDTYSAGSWNSSKLFEKIHHYNFDRKYAITDKIIESFGNLENKKIGILGLTYKPNTSTLRQSIPIEIANNLIKYNAVVSAYDPKANYTEINNIKFDIKNNIDDLIDSSDYLILLTEWKEFKEYDWYSINKKINIFDTKLFLKLNNTKNITYTTI